MAVHGCVSHTPVPLAVSVSGVKLFDSNALLCNLRLIVVIHFTSSSMQQPSLQLVGEDPLTEMHWFV